MARIKNSEDFVKKSILMFAKTVRNEEEYDKFLQNANGVFNTYPLTEDDKEELKEKCSKIFAKNDFVIDEESLSNDFSQFRVVSEQKHIEVPKENVSKIKEFLSKKKVAAGTIILGAGIIGLTSYGIGRSNNSSDNNNLNHTTVTTENVGPTPTATPYANVTQNVVNNTKNPLLNFDPQDKKLMTKKITNFIKDAVPKGYKIKKGEMATEVEDLVNFYIVLNMDNISSETLLKLYQSDNIDVNKLFDSTFRVLAKLDSDAQVSKSIIDVSNLISDKEFASYIKNVQSTSNKVVRASIDKNVSEATSYSKDLNKIIKNGIANNNFRKYSANNTLLSLYLGAFPAANSAKTIGLSKTIMSKSVADMVYVEEKCKTAVEHKGSITENFRREGTDFENGVFSSLESAEEKINLARTTAINLTEEAKANKYANEESINTVITNIINTIKSENVLSTYKANASYKKLYYKNLKVTSTGKSKKVVKSKVVKSKTAKKITKMKKHGKKVTVKNISSKDFIKGTFKTKNGKKIKTTSKSEQISVEEAAKQGYSAGFSKGMSQGSSGKSKSLGNISVPGKYTGAAKTSYINSYKSGFSSGYSEGKKVYDENKNKKTEKVTGTKTEESKVHSKEEPKGGNSSSSSSSSSSGSSSSSSSSSSKVEESDVYDIEDVQSVEKKSSSSFKTKSLDNKIQSLKELRNSIKNLNIEKSYEEENSHVR